MTASSLIPTAEAAFIAGLTDRQMNRVVDEHLMPDLLFERQGNIRRFTRLSAAFAKFYFDADWLIPRARRRVLDELTDRVMQLQHMNLVLALTALPEMSWKVANVTVEVDVEPYIAQVFARVKELDLAGALVTTGPDVMAGAAVFAGTRVPIDIVLGSMAAGIEMDRLVASYPFLTDAHIQAARIYEQVHPRRGRPRRLADALPAAARTVTRVVRPAAG